ncbi:MAG: cytochrome c3 family protein [SAR324 cluster bacterium]|nr:cytochrome c3 family protein [SAR324 cluster bacterium]
MISNCLNKNTVRKALSVGLILAVWVMLGGWKWWGDDHRDIKFNHKLHVQGEEIECNDCHAETAESERATFPEESFCEDCHDETEPDPDSKEGCLLCHNIDPEKLPFRDEGSLAIKMGPEPYKDLLFSHEVHAEQDISCTTCHEDIDEDESLILPRKIYLPTAQQCRNCHVAENIVTDCQSCHEEINTDKAPENHQQGWDRFHGLTAVMSKGGAHQEDCLTCHLQSDCASCHLTEAPRDHTAFWKLRGHGMIVSAERERCSTCHIQESFCSSCHNETAPANHVGNWRVRHCTTCHLDSGFTPENNSCAVCHRTPIHYLR